MPMSSLFWMPRPASFGTTNVILACRRCSPVSQWQFSERCVAIMLCRSAHCRAMVAVPCIQLRIMKLIAVHAGVAWSPDGACILTASDENRYMLVLARWRRDVHRKRCLEGSTQRHFYHLRRLRIHDLPPDVLEARSLGNATELALEGIAAAADTTGPALTVQVCCVAGAQEDRHPWRLSGVTGGMMYKQYCAFGRKASSSTITHGTLACRRRTRRPAALQQQAARTRYTCGTHALGSCAARTAPLTTTTRLGILIVHNLRQQQVSRTLENQKTIFSYLCKSGQLHKASGTCRLIASWPACRSQRPTAWRSAQTARRSLRASTKASACLTQPLRAAAAAP